MHHNSHVLHRQMRGNYPLAASAAGCWITDAAGRKYLDASGGAAVSCLGHAHPDVLAAMHAQIDRIAYAHNQDVLSKLDYPSQLWMEKEIKSVANVTRADVREFLPLAAEAKIKPEFQEYDLEDANTALLEMKQGKIRGSKVLRIFQ